MSDPEEQRDNVHNLPLPRLRMVRDHLEWLFGRAQKEYPQGRVEIAWTDTAGGITQAATFPITPEGLDKAAAEAVRRNLEKRNVYVGVNPRTPHTAPWGRANAAEVDWSCYHFADIDQVAGIARLREAMPLPYTWAVTTGRVPNPRVHPYWQLDEPVTNMVAWRRQQEALADYFESDRVIDAARVMRLAGTVSYPSPRKAALGYKVEQVSLRTLYDGEERDPVTSEAMFHAYPWAASSYSEAGPQPPPGGDRWNTGRKDPQEYVANIKAGHNLHNNARDLIAHLVNTGHRDWLIREFLDRLLRPVSDGGTLGQIEELIRSARQKFNTTEPSEETEDFDAPPPSDLYETLNFEQIAALPPIAYLIQDIITDYGLTIIYGDQSSGKTFLALDMALHLVYGASWHGRETRATGVLYILGEGARGLGKRISAWRYHHSKQTAPAPFRAVTQSPDLLNIDDVQRLVRTIGDLIEQQQVPIGLVVIDTVARAMNGDENDAEVMSRLVSACDAIRSKFNVAIIGIHHCGKDADRGMRGSTALPRASDTILAVSRSDNTMQITVEKQKDDEEAPPFSLEMHQVPIDPLSPQTSLILKQSAQQYNDQPNGKRNGKGRPPMHSEIKMIFDEIERAWRAGCPWSNAPQTQNEGRYLPVWIELNSSATLKQAQQWINAWLVNKQLIVAQYDTRTKQKGLQVLSRPATSA